MQEEDKNVAKHARICFIPRSTGYKMKVLKQLFPSAVLWRERANNRKITDEQTEFLIDLVDKNTYTTIITEKEELCALFKGFSISESGVKKAYEEKN